MTGRPLRFLGLVLGGWICVRAAILGPSWWHDAAQTAPAAPISKGPHSPPPTRVRDRAREATPRTPPPGVIPYLIRDMPYKAAQREPGPNEWPVRESVVSEQGVVSEQEVVSQQGARAATGDGAVASMLLPSDPAASFPPPALSPSPAAGRWSASAWLLVRRDRGGRPGLIPGGTLGASQAGGRLGYRLGRGVSLSARVYAPLRRPAGAELAAGAAWRPAGAVPVEILAERRQAFGAQGRSAFAIAAHGGGSLALPAGLRLDLYGEAGIVGLRSRDAFADASARVSAAVGPIEIGAGAWGGAQPGASRLDAGPTLSWRLPAARANLRLEADWRFRLAGDASPGSGPALTLAADF